MTVIEQAIQTIVKTIESVLGKEFTECFEDDCGNQVWQFDVEAKGILIRINWAFDNAGGGTSIPLYIQWYRNVNGWRYDEDHSWTMDYRNWTDHAKETCAELVEFVTRAKNEGIDFYTYANLPEHCRGQEAALLGEPDCFCDDTHGCPRCYY